MRKPNKYQLINDWLAFQRVRDTVSDIVGDMPSIYYGDALYRDVTPVGAFVFTEADTGRLTDDQMIVLTLFLLVLEADEDGTL